MLSPARRVLAQRFSPLGVPLGARPDVEGCGDIENVRAIVAEAYQKGLLED